MAYCRSLPDPSRDRTKVGDSKGMGGMRLTGDRVRCRTGDRVADGGRAGSNGITIEPFLYTNSLSIIIVL